MTIKEFLRQPEIQDLLNEESLYDIYDLWGEENPDNEHAASELTMFFRDNGIDYLKYTPVVPQASHYELMIDQIVIPSNIIEVSNYAFAGSDLKEIIFEEGTQIINSWAFHNCSDLVNIKLPNTLERIHNGAFENCESLRSITLPDNLDYIGKAVFHNCINLKEIRFKNKIFTVEEFAVTFGLGRGHLI